MINFLIGCWTGSIITASLLIVIRFSKDESDGE